MYYNRKNNNKKTEHYLWWLLWSLCLWNGKVALKKWMDVWLEVATKSRVLTRKYGPFWSQLYWTTSSLQFSTWNAKTALSWHWTHGYYLTILKKGWAGYVEVCVRDWRRKRFECFRPWANHETPCVHDNSSNSNIHHGIIFDVTGNWSPVVQATLVLGFSFRKVRLPNVVGYIIAAETKCHNYSHSALQPQKGIVGDCWAIKSF